MPELVDIRDKNGHVTGEVMTRQQAHKAEAWHGVALVWIYNSKGQVLLQRRAAHLNAFPELWDVTMSGHLAAHEKPRQAAVRELSEELGLYVDAASLQEVSGALSDSFPLVYGKQHNECEYMFLLCQDVDISKLKLQVAEIQEVRWVDARQLEADLQDPVAVRQYAGRNPEIYRAVTGAARWQATLTGAN